MIFPAITFAMLIILLPTAAHRWELKVRHYLPWSILIASLGFLLTWFLSQQFPNVPAILFSVAIVALGGLTSIGAIMYFFFKDPDRQPPNDSRLIVSPADGTVIYIKEITGGNFPFSVKNRNTIPLSEFSREDLIPDRGIQIGIAMNYLNVHVNRSPIAAIVKMVLPVPGKFASLKHITSLLENERTLMVFEGKDLKVGIVQIASRMVRRIVPYVKEGQSVNQGDRVGMIKFGSQVDVLVAYQEDFKIQVTVGDEVTAGESVLIVRGNVG